MRRNWLAGGLLRWLIVPLLLAPALLLATASGALATPVTVIDYFALGDSIASGYGLKGDDGFPCQQSPLAYPQRVRSWLESQYDTVNFTMLACSGAVTSADTQEIASCQQDPQAVADVARSDECQFKSLQNQVDYVLDHLTAAPTLVTITAGINDAGWDDCSSLDACVPRNWFMESDTAFQQDIDNTVAAVKTNLQLALTDLLDETNVTVVFTDYYNPINQGSWFFPLLVYGPQTLGAALTYANPWVGGPFLLYLAQHHVFDQQQSCLTAASHPTAGYQMSCYERTEYGVNAIDEMIAQLANENPNHASVAQLHDAFQAHASPRFVCGSAAPSPAASWIQYPFGNVARGYGLFEQPTTATGNDCFHPNVKGASMIAKYVEDVIPPLGF